MTKRIAIASFVLVLLAALAWVIRRPAPTESASPEADTRHDVAGRAARAPRYHCPMHPTIVYDRPGECPICSMSLVPIVAEHGAAEPDAGVELDAASGLAPVRLSARKRQLIGIKTTPAVRRRFMQAVRAVGRVAYDETRLATVSIKTSGWIERLHADATGMAIRKGQPLLELYSPDLLVAQQEFLLALRTRERTAGSVVPSVAASGDALVASARRRLELLDVSAPDIARLEAGGVAPRSVTIAAPASGVLTRRAVTSGDRVEAGATVLELADATRVWVLASIYESDLPFVKAGAAAAMTLSFLPGRTYRGRVTFLQPALDPETRTVQARLEFPNEDLSLKPEMFCDVRIEADLGERLAVPASSVLESGVRSVVFVARDEGLFEPRIVRVGIRMPGFYEVLEGVAAGESVVTSGNFLVDSESKLEAALAAMTAE